MGPKLLRQLNFSFVIFQNGVVMGNSNRLGKIVVECVKDLSISKVTRKFEWTLDNTRIEKIISAPILGKNSFLFVVSALLAVSHCPKLQSGAILGKTNDETLIKWQNPTLIWNPIWRPRNFFQGFYLHNVPSYHPMQFPGKLMN